jgi:hypothetical protein
MPVVRALVLRPTAIEEFAMTVGVVLSPVFESRAASTADAGWDGTSYRLGSLVGRRVGVRGDTLWRSWGWVSDEWEPHLEALGAELSSWQSETRGGAEADRSDKELQAFLEGLDVAIVGLGTCGSCTMWTMHDALAAADRGIPTVAVVTEHFAPLARTFAERGGRPDLPLFVLPYPLETRPESEVREIARVHVDGILAMLGVRP